MKPEVKSAIDKLKIVRNLAQAPETKQVCDIVIELVDAMQEKETLGFGVSDESKRKNTRVPK